MPPGDLDKPKKTKQDMGMIRTDPCSGVCVCVCKTRSGREASKKRKGESKQERCGSDGIKLCAGKCGGGDSRACLQEPAESLLRVCVDYYTATEDWLLLVLCNDLGILQRLGGGGAYRGAP
jgi:hypothetical protein